MKIQSVDRDIKALFSAHFFQIPRFQRAYSWGKDEVKEFWDDVVNSGDDGYFIGSMVAFKSGSDYLGIVDGQQRLTTITLILCAIRDEFAEMGNDDLARGIQNFVERKNVDNENTFIIDSETSYPYLQEAIQKFPTKQDEFDTGPEEVALKVAFDYFSEQIIGILPPNDKQSQAIRIQKLKELRDKILSLKVIFIDLDTEDDAYIVFETLNARGRDLSTADLVKNHITKLWKKSNKGVDRAKDKWQEISDLIDKSIESSNLNDFLVHYWTSKHSSVTKKTLFRGIKQTINRDNVIEFVDSLKREARAYTTIFDPESRKWTKQEIALSESLLALRIFNVSQPTPLLLSALAEYREKTIKLKDLKSLFATIEAFHFLSTAIASQHSSGGISGIYARHSRRLRQDSNKQKVLKDIQSDLKKRIPDFQKFRAGFLTLRFSDDFTKSRKLIRYILRKIDAINRPVPADYNRFSIEHIAPQNPKVQTLGMDVIGSIGNLTFISGDANVSLENKLFSEKKQRLCEHTSPSLDAGLSTADEWTEVEINARAEQLAKIAYEKVWSP